MGGLQVKTDLPMKHKIRGCCCPEVRGVRHTRLDTVATSKLVSVGALFVLRVAFLLFLLFGGVWMAWRQRSDGRFDEEPPPLLCLPDWSYVVTMLYFLMAALACLRQTNVRPFTPHSAVSVNVGESVSRSLASTATLFLLEISVVFQTTSVPITWIEHSRNGRDANRALVSTVALGAVLTDLFLNRSRVEAKHTWIMLGFLLIWAIEQVAWVYSDSGNEACYEAFDVKGLYSLLTAIIVAIAVVSVTFAYAALCAQRDRLTSQFDGNVDSNYMGPDVEEDVGQEAAVTDAIPLPAAPNLRAPPASERCSVVNPIFAGSGSRMNRQWPNSGHTGEHRTSLASTATEMSSGEDCDAGWQTEGDLNTSANSSGRHPKASSAVAPIAGGGLTAHPSSWTGYGGASAWVRSSSRDVTPSARGGKSGNRRGACRF